MTFNTAAKIGVGIGITGLATKYFRVSDPISIIGLTVMGQALAWMPGFVSSCLRGLRPPPTPGKLHENESAIQAQSLVETEENLNSPDNQEVNALRACPPPFHDDIEGLSKIDLRKRDTRIITRTTVPQKLNDIKKLNKALEEFPEAIHYRLDRAKILLARGKETEALADYEFVLSRHPANEVAQDAVNRLKSIRKNVIIEEYQKVRTPQKFFDIEEITKAIEESIPYRLERAKILVSLGQETEALADYEFVLSRDPANEVAQDAVNRLKDESSVYIEKKRHGEL